MLHLKIESHRSEFVFNCKPTLQHSHLAQPRHNVGTNTPNFDAFLLSFNWQKLLFLLTEVVKSLKMQK
jgi:hypothetical protein